VDVLAGPSHEDMRVADSASRVTMTRVRHPCFEQTVVRRCTRLEHQLIRLIHRCWRQVEVAPTDHENTSSRANLYQLEVVREIIRRVSLVWLDAFGRNVVDLVLREAVVSLERENCLAVLVKHINLVRS